MKKGDDAAPMRAAKVRRTAAPPGGEIGEVGEFLLRGERRCTTNALRRRREAGRLFLRDDPARSQPGRRAARLPAQVALRSGPLGRSLNDPGRRWAQGGIVLSSRNAD